MISSYHVVLRQVVLAVTCLIFSFEYTYGQALPVCVEWVTFAGSPTGFAAPPGNSQYLFIGELGGAILRYDRTTGTVLTVLDISTDPTTFLQEGESGLLHLAFHPNFQSNNLFYILQSVPTGV